MKFKSKYPSKNGLTKEDKSLITDTIIFFKKNKNEWFKSEDLSRLIGIKHVRLVINYIRIYYKLPIVSSRRGYKYSTDKVEIEECYQDLKYRALSMLSAAKSMKQ